MELQLIADTNLFFECRSLEQLPWSELGYDPIVIILTKPVLDEIDKHKKANGRTRARALEIFGRIRTMLMASVQDVELQTSSPKVLLRRMPNIKPDPALKEELDYAKTDEKIVGIASTLNNQASGYSVKLFTDDTGPATTADSLGVPYLMINESWRRPHSETTEEKKIKELEKDLATYRAQEPKISIGLCAPADESNFVKVTKKVVAKLEEPEIEAIISELRLKHPLISDFTPPPPSSTTSASGEVTTTVYSPPTESDINAYRDVQYPKWIEQCRKILNSLHEGRDETESPIVVRWPMSNKGTRPASKVRIEFEAKGALTLQRLDTNGEDEENSEAEITPEAHKAPISQFPSAPRPPSFQRQVSYTPSPTKTTLRQRDGISTLKAFNSLGENYKGIMNASDVLRLGQLGTLSSQLKDFNSATDAARLMAQHSNPFGARELNALLNPTYATISHRSFTPQHFHPHTHEAESFYYDWPARQQVKKGALTCDLWRHQTGEEIFEFEVHFTIEGEARGIVQCTIHAENLTKPEKANVAIIRTLESISLLEEARAMVANCG